VLVPLAVDLSAHGELADGQGVGILRSTAAGSTTYNRALARVIGAGIVGR
jgi:hypothetical protein